jgi:hypothetical protein
MKYSIRDLELMAEDQIFESDVPPRPNGSNQGAKRKEK